MRPHWAAVVLFLASRLASADCSTITSSDQTGNAKAAQTKFDKIGGCALVIERLNEYDGNLPEGHPEPNTELQRRCAVTTALLADSIATCDQAKTEIKELEISNAVSKLMPQMLAEISAETEKSLPAAQVSPSPTPQEAPSPTPETAEKVGFLHRFLDAYNPNVQQNVPAPPTPGFRGFPAPLTSPPFPNAVWPYGGSSTIGQPNSAVGGPLMQGIGTDNPVGQTLEHYRINIYGWLNGGANISSSKGGGYANAPAAYLQRANNVQVDQLALFIERVPDTVQNDHFDWGFRVTTFYGLDYRFTTSKGIFSNQLLQNNRENGADIPMAYLDLYFPVMDGLNVRVGRFISVPDIEAQLAPSNYTYSHSFLYDFDCYTQTGVVATLKLNKNWLVQGGVTAGNDVAPWTKDAQPTGLACLGYTFQGGRQNVYVCDNSINSGKYAYNNMNQYNATYYNKLSKNWHTANEFLFEKERNVPNVNGPIIPEVGANPAFCTDPTKKTCTMHEYGYVNYLERQFGPNNYLSIRNGFINDVNGQRTGTPGMISDNVVGWGHWIANQRILFRPEVGYDRGYGNAHPFDNGTKKTQKYAAIDVIVTF